jgi:drug/metabolite transporter (DMT)-like permease
VTSTTAPARPANDGAFTTTDWALFLSIATIWGSSFLLIDIGLDVLPPGLITLLRVGLGALALAVLPKPSVSIRSEDRVRLAALSILWVAIPFTLFPLAEQRINSAVTGLLNGATPIFAALIGAAFFRQRATGSLRAGLVIGFVGISMISAPTIGEGSSQTSGVLMVIGATLCYGIAVNLAAPLQQRYGSLPLMTRVLTVATVLVTPYGLSDIGAARFEAGPTLAVVVLGVMCTGIAFAIMATLVGRVGSTRASFITYLIPVVSLLLGVAFRDDTVAPVALAGIVLVIGGALMASRPTLTQRRQISAAKRRSRPSSHQPLWD